MSSSTKILVGLVSGVFVGIFFGEHAGVLKIVADGFVKLLQMTVLPYITHLDHHQSGNIELRSGENARAPSRGGSHWPVVFRADFYLPHSLGVSRHRNGVVFQHHAGRAAPAV